ncbi:regulatory signaling modulator protein AmpE [Marinimicrobium koreense]|uniref:regulatory signaling modulator protein AmpE n=1 Tax=Marinimicrobium koreense TaxID=306545 RepID=UPI003F6F4045
MTFLSVFLVLVLVQWWGSGAPLQKDGWFDRYLHWLEQRPSRAWPKLQLLLAVVAPALVLWLLTWAVAEGLSQGWLIFIAVPVLLYSLGRGDFSAEVQAYVEASEREDSVSAARHLAALQGNAVEDADPEDWASMHRQALKTIAYRGCERMFAVLFWFLVLGPAGALMYRLSVLYRERSESAQVHRWLWLMEWPVVRVMGFTWAMAGNFDSCFFRCQRDLGDTRQGTSVLLYDQMLGALGRTEPEPADSAVDLDMIRASQPLYSRSLLLWVCVLALITLLA